MAGLMQTAVKVFGSPALQAVAAARLVLSRALECVHDRSRFTLVLAGGSTPAGLYNRLASGPEAMEFPWHATHIFWGDERCVGPEDPRSNSGNARRRLIDRVPVPAGQVHPMPAALSPPDRAARTYETELRAFFNIPNGMAGMPVFDLVILGLGPDGHTASLFPAGPELDEQVLWVTAVTAPATAEPPVPRLTLTLPAINQARMVLFMASGAAKREIFKRIHNENAGPGTVLPASLVQPQGELLWYVTDDIL